MSSFWCFLTLERYVISSTVFGTTALKFYIAYLKAHYKFQ